MSERWDLYDEANRPTGEELRRGERMPKGRYHRVVEAWIRTPDGRYILQKRSMNKKNYPGYWSCTACGSAIKGETPEEAMIREMQEEMGIRLEEDELILDRIITEFPAHYYIYRIEKELTESDITMDPEEVDDFIFLDKDAIMNWVETRHMTKLSYYREFFEKWK
ncbi:NUDIX hydrolase [Peptoniphilus sp. HCN-40583]|uniref:NUDIX hydrolase n=1 Tax=Peptoniphilus sp. HCN-40583 TaxID=3134662 RepID=UPI0030BD0870